MTKTFMVALVTNILLAIWAVPQIALAQGPVPGVPSADGITFAVLATTAGATIAAGIVFGIIQVLKGAFPAFVDRLTGAGLAFVLTAFLYVAVGYVLQPPNADGYLVIFLSWLNCALVSVGIHATSVTTAVRVGGAALRDSGVADKVVAAQTPVVQFTQTTQTDVSLDGKTPPLTVTPARPKVDPGTF